MAEKGSRAKLLILLLVLLLVLVSLGVFGYGGIKRFFSAQQADTCTVTGQDGGSQTMSSEQAVNAATVAAVALERNMYPQAATIGLATVSVETNYVNLPYGDLDSAGLFQQRPSQGWGTAAEVQDPVNAANSFYNHLEAIGNYQNLPVGRTAQRVQLSGYPDRYQEHADEAKRWADAFTGTGGAHLSCVVPEAEQVSLPVTSLEDELVAHFGATVQVQKVNGNLRVRATGTYSGAGSLSADEAKHAVLLAVAHWSVAQANPYSLNAIEFDGKMWARDKNIDRTFTDPQGWQESSASADTVLIQE